MHDNTSLFNTQTRGELIEKRIYNMGWGETSPGTNIHTNS